MVSNWVQWRGPDRDMERRVRQIRELVRLCNSLHADVGLREILTQLADAVSSTIGFGIAAFNLIREGNERMEIAAVAGLAPPEYQRLVELPPRVDGVIGLMRAEFCISHSYYINHRYKHLIDSVESIAVMPPLPPGAPQPPDAWHPDDMLLVPLVSPRDGRWLGILSLDQPEDGKVPTVETIEVVELFANQAAIAIDMATLFEEREHERRAIEGGLITLLYHMEQVGQGNLAVRTELDGTALSPIAETLNAVLSQLSGVLADVRGASEVVSRSAAEMQAAATTLAAGARQQAQQILDVSSAVAGMAEGVRHISETASSASSVAEEANAISHEGREAAERAAAGMTSVREMTLQSSKKMKRLGESTQEIGAIVQMVSDFANQTNLLALNAAIEAARAGEHGRGFAVVAQEVRNLASSSAEATKAISARIKGIQNDTNAVVVTIEESTRQVVIQSELASQAGAALGAVDSVTQHIAESIGEISQTAGQQAQAAEMVARSMNDIAQITAQTRDSMAQMRGSMEHLATLAGALLRSIGIFRLGTAYGPLSGELWMGQNGRYPESGARQPLLPPGSPETVAEQVTQPMPAISFPGMPNGEPTGHPPATGSGTSVPTGPLPRRAPITARLPVAGAAAPVAADVIEINGHTGGAGDAGDPGDTNGIYPFQQQHVPGARIADVSELDIPPPPPGLEHWGRR